MRSVVFRVGWVAILMGACQAQSDSGDARTGVDFGQIVPITVDYGVFDTGHDEDPGAGCSTSAQCPAEAPWCDPARQVCVECLNHSHCPAGGYCVEGTCRTYLCEPHSVSCVNNEVKVCDDTGYAYVQEFPCGDLVCVEGECLVCRPGQRECTPQNQTKVCRADGSGWDLNPCGEQKCIDGACLNCVPLSKKCVGTQVHRCTEDGSHYEFLEDCDTEKTGKLCHLGLCVKLCEYNEKFKTNLGCEYYAIDMDQFDDKDPLDPWGPNAPFAVVISNTTEGFTATVVVSRDGNLVKQVSAPPRQATIIGLDPLNIVGTTKAKLVYRIQSNLPIVAYQFNPLENVGVYSNDASLLLPVNALGKRYMVLAWPSIGYNSAFQMLASNFAVVGVREEPTPVRITVTAKTLAGGGVPALGAGQTWETTLARGEVLNIEAAEQFGDLTGSIVEAEDKVAVFAGHVCANAPISNCVSGKCSYDPTYLCSVQSDCPSICCCDHIEEQLPPLSAWGRRYVVPRSWPRGKAPDVVRILAAEDGTHVTVTPAVTSVPVLNAGQFHEFEISDHVEVTADKQVLVGQYLEAQDAPGAAHANCVDTWTGEPCEKVLEPKICHCYDVLTETLGASCTTQAQCSPNDANIGDPSFIIAVPVEQFRKEYVFLVPTKYASNYLAVVAPAGANVTLDGAPVGQFVSVGSGTYKVARMPIAEGSHVVSADDNVGIVVYGWDWYVSYGYPGGMRTETLKIW